MNNVQICHRCIEGFVSKHDGTGIDIKAMYADDVNLVKSRLSVFTPSVRHFYMSLKNTYKMLNRKNAVAFRAVDKMKSGNYTSVAIRRAERLLSTISNNLSIVAYMIVFIENCFEDEVSVLQPSMSFSELEGILND